MSTVQAVIFVCGLLALVLYFAFRKQVNGAVTATGAWVGQRFPRRAPAPAPGGPAPAGAPPAGSGGGPIVVNRWYRYPVGQVPPHPRAGQFTDSAKIILAMIGTVLVAYLVLPIPLGMIEAKNLVGYFTIPLIHALTFLAVIIIALITYWAPTGKDWAFRLAMSLIFYGIFVVGGFYVKKVYYTREAERTAQAEAYRKAHEHDYDHYTPGSLTSSPAGGATTVKYDGTGKITVTVADSTAPGKAVKRATVLPARIPADNANPRFKIWTVGKDKVYVPNQIPDDMFAAAGITGAERDRYYRQRVGAVDAADARNIHFTRSDDPRTVYDCTKVIKTDKDCDHTVWSDREGARFGQYWYLVTDIAKADGRAYEDTGAR